MAVVLKQAQQAIMDDLTRFSGFHTNRYREPFLNGFAFIFMTKPLLFIDYKNSNTDKKNRLAYMNMARDPFFVQYLDEECENKLDKKLVEILSYNTDKYNVSSFIPMFTNQFRNFNSGDVSLGTTDAFDTEKGYMETLPTFSDQSKGASQISFQVQEDANMSFTKLLGLWVNYIDNISSGVFDANPDMVLNGALDYMSSIYYFVTEPDGKTLKYWCKYNGCYPSAIPYSSISFDRGSFEFLQLPISFNYTVREDMNPKILEEFNILSFKLMDQDIGQFYASTGLYSSIKNSPLLNAEKMKTTPGLDLSSTFESEKRDPIVLFAESGEGYQDASEKRESHFELVFDDYGYTSEIETIFQDAYKNNGMKASTTMDAENYYVNDIYNNNALRSFKDIWSTENSETIE